MDTHKSILVHLCDAKSWSLIQQRGELCPEPGIGFVHLSAPGQVHWPANRLYRGCGDLMLLHVDPGRLASPVRWEPGTESDPEAMMFPHLYGPLPVSAVTSVVAYPPGPDGLFGPVRINRSTTPDAAD